MVCDCDFCSAGRYISIFLIVALVIAMISSYKSLNRKDG